ncbi:L-ribulokinase [Pedobacter sp. UYP30]|uniref:ribulokinase n=1 Tax=Pedobacter sp. UYP30 TaxID=1756400 RepID=UPI0033990969
MSDKNYVIGVDFGTDSVRAVILDASNGEELSAAVVQYPRWKVGLYCDASISQFRQHPADYVEGMTEAITQSLGAVNEEVAKNIRAISVDTTGSTPVAVNEEGTPLALLPEFSENPNAMFILWKDHTAVAEAAEINAHAKLFDNNYLQYVGGIYSSEWFWAKFLRTLRTDEQVKNACHSWVEHCDWIPFLLTGGNCASDLKRGVCAAGHKALWAEEFDGLPPKHFFTSLSPLLKNYGTLFDKVYTSSMPAGNLSAAWAETLGLSENVKVGIGAFDAHMGAVGGQIEPYYLSKVMGTSTCDMLVAPTEEVKDKLVSGICGQVNGSIIPGMMGMEAGQSAFGDAYAWFKEMLLWPTKNLLGDFDASGQEKILESLNAHLIATLSEKAAQLEVKESDEIAIDWLNGRRTPNANQALTGAFMGLNLGTDAVRMFRSLVEATCFGAKKIIDQFVKEGVEVKGLIGLGGVAKKSPFIMQMMADVTNMPIKIHKSEQTCAVGAGMFAATVAGIYPTVEEAMLAMGQGFDKEYHPNTDVVGVYARRYKKYCELGDYIEKSIN